MFSRNHGFSAKSPSDGKAINISKPSIFSSSLRQFILLDSRALLTDPRTRAVAWEGRNTYFHVIVNSRLFRPRMAYKAISKPSPLANKHKATCIIGLSRTHKEGDFGIELRSTMARAYIRRPTADTTEKQAIKVPYSDGMQGNIKTFFFVDPPRENVNYFALAHF